MQGPKHAVVALNLDVVHEVRVADDRQAKGRPKSFLVFGRRDDFRAQHDGGPFGRAEGAHDVVTRGALVVPN